MTVDRNRNKELMLKLRALAERGVGGEKDAAAQKLALLMAKYGLEEADLNDNLEEEHDFHYKTEFEKDLLRQLFYKIVPDFASKTYVYQYGKGSRTTYGITCTKAQAIQIGIEYDFYRDLWKEEQEFLFRCFIQKHAIFNPNPKEAKPSTLSDEEMLRMMQMMQGMQDKSLTAQLPDKTRKKC